MTDAVTFGSLFSGAGGFDLGLESATWNGIGMTCKFQVEWDKHCQQVLQYHWADVPKWEDVQQVNGANLPPVDVIAWGSPCQDLSLAGKRAGLDGEKSSMFFEGIRIIKEMREATNGTYPTVSIWENVAGAIISNNGNDFETVIRELAEAGCHHIEWRVLDAQWFGVAQRRKRIFVVAVWGSPASIRSGQQILAVRKSSTSSFAQSGEQRQTDSRRTVADSASSSESEPIVLDSTRPQKVRYFNDGHVRTLTATMGTGGGNVPMVAYLNEEPSWWNGKQIASTITSSSHRQFMPDKDQWLAITQMQKNQRIIRRLTEIECERLMGWNDDHTRFRADGKETASSQRYKMCGNGVAAPVATWIGERVIEAIRTDKELEQ
jgi:DNA (cytosine-5)-methyltransferase 1